MHNKASIILGTNKKSVKTKNSEYVFHISSSDTGGEISLYEAIFNKIGKNKNLHYHKVLTETFTVLEGEFYFNLDKEKLILKKNDSIVIPPLIIHGFRAKVPNSKLLIGFTDSPNRDDFFIGLSQIVNGELILNKAEINQFYNKYDQYQINE
ncbi:cupin domain-containing protein [Ulvibacter litoralis]|uniref:Cupin domain-containing protein n=1 Tax=Ulvibacter litoralis TaxID=227084 RepID=A0A1G7IHS6_9FLAO|nr:cupin domain-containing protein [Ulvibacter litoralis]GHC60843.1 hypothetical protein GCM10008083_27350 [Ulvibacter litoralis]SDF12138.1 Cupin domain-containing protein [Ulvibacter litoralis]